MPDSSGNGAIPDYAPSLRLIEENDIIINDDVRKNHYNNCLVVFIAFEIGDTSKKLSNAYIEIFKIYESLKLNEIVLVPNVHLTNTPLMPFKESILLYNELFRLLKNLIFEVSQEPFGYCGNWTISGKPHSKSVLGRQW